MTQRGEGHRVYQDCYCEEARSAADVISTLSVIPFKMSSFKSFSEVGTTSAALGHKNNLTNWRRNVLDDWFDSPKTYFNKSNFMKQLGLCAGEAGRAGQWDGRQIPAESICQVGNDQLTQKEEPTRLFYLFHLHQVKGVRGVRGMPAHVSKPPPPMLARDPQNCCLCSISDTWPHWWSLSLFVGKMGRELSKQYETIGLGSASNTGF